MPTYEWECNACGHVTEVFRHMTDCGMAPIRVCECGAQDWRKMVSDVRVNLAGKEAHKSPFPVTIPGYEKRIVLNPDGSVAKDVMGRPVVKYADVTFKDRAEQDAYMKKHNLVRTMDGRDPTIGASQHSVYDQPEPPPPTPHAVELAKSAHFVEPREIYDNL